MTAPSRQEGKLHTILFSGVRSPQRLRRLLQRRRYDRRSGWVEQVHRTPTVHELHQAGAGRPAR
jgi:hypothetical protein